MGADPADDHYGDDDPSTISFRGFEDCAVDESVSVVTALPIGRRTEFAIPRSSSKCFMTMFQLRRRLGFFLNILFKGENIVSGIVDVCGATFSMEDLPGTPEPSEDDEDDAEMGQNLLKVEMGDDLAESLKKLCSQQHQFTLPPSPVSNESEGTCSELFQGVLRSYKNGSAYHTLHRFNQPRHREHHERQRRLRPCPKDSDTDEKVQPEECQVGGQNHW